MSKLFKLKEWLIIPEAARHLSAVFDEEVNEADILRLALDKHLKLSVNFVNKAYAKRGKVVTLEDTIWDAVAVKSNRKKLQDFPKYYNEEMERASKELTEVF